MVTSDPARGAIEQNREPAHLVVQTAEVRMQEALDALESAVLRSASLRELEALEAALFSAEAAYIATFLTGQVGGIAR